MKGLSCTKETIGMGNMETEIWSGDDYDQQQGMQVAVNTNTNTNKNKNTLPLPGRRPPLELL
jgi:hypothetical protein